MRFFTRFLATLLVVFTFLTVNAQNRPFPSNFPYAFGITPTTMTATGFRGAEAAYISFKTDFITSCTPTTYRVKWDEPDKTVSEGIGYGMLVTAYWGKDDSQTIFDGLWRTYKQNTNAAGLMNWQISGCSGSIGNNGATDADQDAAMALIIADCQWGSSGTINYRAEATDLIKKIWQFETFPCGGRRLMKPGDAFSSGCNCTNASYFSPAYYRAYAEYDTANAAGWRSFSDDV